MVVIFGPNLDPVILTIGLAALPAIIPRVRAIIAARRQPQNSEADNPNIQDEAPSTTMRALAALVVVHSLYILFTLFFDAPSNIFKSLKIPLTTPVPTIRQTLLSFSPSQSVLPPALEILLSRLQSFDARVLYVRFGHNTVTECDYCHSFWDFGLFSLPGAGVQYVRMAAVVGLLTMRGSGKRKWR